MIDDILFQRGCILTRIDNQTDDFDNIVSDYYFEKVLGLHGEVIDSNGSDYELISLDADDNFEIDFSIADTMFETAHGATWEFEELVVKCTGTIIQENEKDILDIDTYNVVSKA